MQTGRLGLPVNWTRLVDHGVMGMIPVNIIAS